MTLQLTYCYALVQASYSTGPKEEATEHPIRWLETVNSVIQRHIKYSKLRKARRYTLYWTLKKLHLLARTPYSAQSLNNEIVRQSQLNINDIFPYYANNWTSQSLWSDEDPGLCDHTPLMCYSSLELRTCIIKSPGPLSLTIISRVMRSTETRTAIWISTDDVYKEQLDWWHLDSVLEYVLVASYIQGGQVSKEVDLLAPS